MSKPAGIELPEEVVNWLIGGNPIIVATVDDGGSPYTCIVGSGVAVDASRVRFALFSNSRTLANLRVRPKVFLETLGDDLVMGMAGTAAVIKDPMKSSAYPPHHYTMVEVVIETVKDDHPPGARVTGMSYDFTTSRQPEERLRRRRDLVEELLQPGAD